MGIEPILFTRLHPVTHPCKRIECGAFACELIKSDAFGAYIQTVTPSTFCYPCLRHCLLLEALTRVRDTAMH